MNVRCALAVLALGLAPAAFADPARDDAALPKNLVLLDLGLHVVGAGYQRTLGPEWAVQVDLDSWTPWTEETHATDASGLIVRARATWYAFGTAPTGLWFSPFVQGGAARATVDGEVKTGPTWALGASVGYAWLLFGHLHLSVGAGGQFNQLHFQDGEAKPGFAQFWPTLDGTLGWAF